MRKNLKLLAIAMMVCLAMTGCGGSSDAGNTTTTTTAPKSEAVVSVETKIKSIGDVTNDSKTAIDEAETAYNALSDEDKKAVSNYSTLESAKTSYNELLKKAAEAIVTEINALGDITIDKADTVKSLRERYNALTTEQQALVTNEATLKAAEEKISSLKKDAAQSKLKVLNKNYDKIEQVTWYEPSALPEYIDIRCYLLPYIGVKDNGTSWLVIRYNYTEDDWVFWKKATILVDGEYFYKTVSYFDMTRDNDGGNVWEYYDEANVSTDEVEMLRKIATSKEATIRFQGDDYYFDYTIPAKDKKAITQVLEAWDALN